MLRCAWRNLWRNSRRTAITLAAVTLNTALLIFIFAMNRGMLRQTLENATGVVMGEAQAHAPDYLEDRSLYKLLQADAILEIAKKNGVGAAARLYGYGLVSGDRKSAGAFFWGIDPAQEKASFKLATYIKEGRFLPEAPEGGVLLGKKLAHSLQADIGDEIVVLVQAADGSLGNELYTVSGILKAIGDSIDRSAVIMHEKDFRSLFVLQKGVHEIAFHTGGKKPAEEIRTLVASASNNAEVKTWRELSPVLSDMLRVSHGALYVFLAIFFLAAALGVMNTMLMATYERIHEFGILKAVGASPWRIVMDVLSEALVLSGFAAAMGACIGVAVSYYFQLNGLDLTGVAGDVSFAGMAFDPIWRAALSFRTVIEPVGVMCTVCVLASLYPAVIAARLDPVEAIRHV